MVQAAACRVALSGFNSQPQLHFDYALKTLEQENTKDG
jgi:hypothetical protein